MNWNYHVWVYSGLPNALNGKVAGQTSIPEKRLGANLTQFDAQSRIPANSLGSWDNFSGPARDLQAGQKFLGYRRKQRPTISGARCPDHGAGVWSQGRRARALLTAIQPRTGRTSSAAG